MISRATLLLMCSQVVFLLSGFLINSGLARLLQPIDYGTFGLVMSVLVVVELFVITGIPEAIQKYGGEHPEAMPRLISKTLPWQIGYATTVFLLFWLAAPLLAKAFGDATLTFYFRVAGIDIIVYALYKYFLGVQNGLHRFTQYTVLGVTYSLTKLASIFALVWLGFSVTGALVGNMLGSVFALLLSMFVSRLGKSEAEPESIPYLSFVVQNVLYFVGLNLFFSVDLWFVKSFLSPTGVGIYVSAGVLAKLTYFVSIALSAMLLPSLARTKKLEQSERNYALTRDSLRYLIIFLVLINTIVIVNAEDIIRLFFGESYLRAAPILRILMAGLSMVTLMAVINTIMIADDKMKACLVMILGLLALDVTLNLVLVPRYQLWGAAVSTTIVGFIGTGVAGFFIPEIFKSLFFSLSILRLAGISALLIALTDFFRSLPLDVIVQSALIGLIYLTLLWITREINAVDLRRLRESFGLSHT